MEKTKGKAARTKPQSAQQRRKIKAVGELRNAMPIHVAEINAKKNQVSNTPRAMLLVNDILSPSDTESAALALGDLINLVCDTDKKADRIELDFYCTAQSILYFEEWDVLLRKLIDAMRTKRQRKETTEDGKD